MRILLIDPFEETIPPTAAGNAIRFFHGLVLGGRSTILSVRRTYAEMHDVHGVFRPGSLSDAMEHASSFDAVIVPSNMDWFISGKRIPYGECLTGIKTVVHTYGGESTLARSDYESGLNVRHCVNVRRSSVKKGNAAIMLSSIHNRSVILAGEACRRNKLTLNVIGDHVLREIRNAIHYGTVSEEEKTIMLSEAAVCVVIRSGRPFGSPALLEPAACGTPTAAVDFHDGSAITEYVSGLGKTTTIENDDETIIKSLTATIDEVRGYSSLDLESIAWDTYSPKAFRANVESAILNGVGPFDRCGLDDGTITI